MGIRNSILLLLLFLSEAIASGQVPLEGKVTYITSQHVYVRFSSTEGLADGDTLYMQESRGDVPVLVILSHSSTSCVCEPLGDREFKLSEQVIGRPEKLASDESAATGTGKDTTQVMTPVALQAEESGEPEGGSALESDHLLPRGCGQAGHTPGVAPYLQTLRREHERAVSTVPEGSRQAGRESVRAAQAPGMHLTDRRF